MTAKLKLEVGCAEVREGSSGGRTTTHLRDLGLGRLSLGFLTLGSLTLGACSGELASTAEPAGSGTISDGTTPVAGVPTPDGVPAVPGVPTSGTGLPPATPGVTPAGGSGPVEGEVVVGPDGTVSCTATSASKTTLRRLTINEYANAVQALLGVEIDETLLAADTTTGPFATNRATGVSLPAAQGYQGAAESVAEAALGRLDQLVSCDGGDRNAECAMDFIQDFAHLAYRRALSADETAELDAAYRAGEDEQGFAYGLRGVIEHVLQSPFFLYQVERSEPVAGLTGVERLTGVSTAEKLASFLWESIPDRTLLDAAEQGELATPAGVRLQAERMLNEPLAAEAFVSFFGQWFGVEEIELAQKDPNLFPGFDRELAGAMRQETESFVRWMFESNNFTLRELFTSNKAFPGEALADFYGVDEAAPGDPVDLDSSRRYGMVTHPSVMATHSHATKTSIVGRGAFIREKLLCQPLPDPPADVDTSLPERDETQSAREQLAAHREQAACFGCHSLIDDLGFAFENFDAVGAYRTTDNGMPIDTSGELSGTTTAGAFSGADELIEQVITSQEGVDCAVAQWMRFAQRRMETPSDACSRAIVSQAFEAANFDFRALILATVESDSFRYRDPTPLTSLEQL